MIQFALAVVSAICKAWKRSDLPLARIVAIGSAAAVVAVYQAPIAGAFFAVEIVAGVQVLSWGALAELPGLLIAAFTAATVSSFLLKSHALFALDMPFSLRSADANPVLLLACLIGCLGPLYVRLIRSTKWLRQVPFAVVWSGIIVGGLSCINPQVWGNGDGGVLLVLHGNIGVQLALLILTLRLIATASCVGAGVAGGVFTPTVFAGSIVGIVAGHSLSVLPNAAPPAIYAVFGIGCLLAASTHAPMMAGFMTLELTGTTHCTTGMWSVFACS